MRTALAAACEKYRAIPNLFVLMPNHFHLILTTPLGNIDVVMQYFISEATRAIQLRANRINHIFGGRYRWSFLKSAAALGYAYKYVARNPVRAGLAASVEQYDFSTLASTTSALPIADGIGKYWQFIPQDYGNRLEWLNRRTPKEQEELIGKALRRYNFQFTKDSNFQKNLRLLRQEYGIESPLL